MQILGSDGKRNGISDCLMEAVICPFLEENRKVVICALVEVVPQFVVVVMKSSSRISMHIFSRRSSLKSRFQALAWHTTSRSRGLTNSERSQKV